jgi:hypothetical protein
MYGKQFSRLNMLVISISAALTSAYISSCGTELASLDPPQVDQPGSAGPEAETGGRIASDAAAVQSETELSNSRTKRSVSYAPGEYCILVYGISWPNVLQYGDRGGDVSEGAGQNWVELSTDTPTSKAWIQYYFSASEGAVLQNLRIFGSGTKLSVFMYNWNTLKYDFQGTFALSSGPIVPELTFPYKRYNQTYLRLVQEASAESRICEIRADVN